MANPNRRLRMEGRCADGLRTRVQLSPPPPYQAPGSSGSGAFLFLMVSVGWSKFASQMVYRHVNALTAVDAAYLAGLIDGEGTVTLTRLSRNRERGLAVTISNTELNILEHVLSCVGVGKITNKRKSGVNHTPSYTYQITNRQALDLLRQIGPFLRSHKAARAQMVLKEYLRLTPRNGRYTKEQLHQRETFVREFFEIRPADQTGRLRPRLAVVGTAASSPLPALGSRTDGFAEPAIPSGDCC